MNTIERIRAVVHASDLEAVAGRTSEVLIAARDRGNPAHGYLAANLTPMLRDMLVDRLASLMELVSKTTFEDWRVNLPSAYAPDMVMCLPHHIADAAWRVWATRDVLALAWNMCKHEVELFEDYHDPEAYRDAAWDDLATLWRCIDCGDTLEAQKYRNRVAREMPGYMRHAQGEYKRRVFAEAILDLWLGRDDLGLVEVVRQMDEAYYAELP